MLYELGVVLSVEVAVGAGKCFRGKISGGVSRVSRESMMSLNRILNFPLVLLRQTIRTATMMDKANNRTAFMAPRGVTLGVDLLGLAIGLASR